MTAGETPPSDDAQRDLERHALRNVRGLVDKIEHLDEKAGRNQKRMLVGLIVGTTLVVGIIVGTLIYVSDKQMTKPVVVDPAKLPPIQPGPPK